MKKSLGFIFFVLILLGVSGVFATCIDSDSGSDYYKTGLSSGELFDSKEYGEFKDYCESPELVGYGVEYGKLIEYVCNNESYVEDIKYNCPNGCKDGACIEGDEAVVGCIDSDSGKNYFSKGHIKNDRSGEVENEDVCFDPHLENARFSGGYVSEGPILIEYYCSSTVPYESVRYECPNGCKDGACIKGERVKKVEDFKESESLIIRILNWFKNLFG